MPPRAQFGPKGERTIAARDFFKGMLQSAVAPDEVLTEVTFPYERKRAGSAYRKLRQAASGFAVVGVAVQLVLDRRGRCDSVSVALTGVNTVPFRASSLEAELAGREPTDETVAAACDRYM